MAYGVGAALRAERMRLKVSLADVADQTRISQRFLTAIEDENFDQLPGVVFTRNFVRQYALALHMDPDPLLSQLQKVDIADAPIPEVPSRSQQEPRWDPRWNSVIAGTAWFLFAAVAVLAAWVYFNRATPTKAETRGPAPVAKARPQPIATPAPAAPAPVVQAAPASVPPDASHPVRVVLTAREESWVQVSADGKLAFTATLQPNETRSVAAGDQVKVVTGNAGGILISLNGKTLDSLGPSGQVRTVRLTAEGLQLAPKTPPPPPPSDRL